MPDTEHLDEDKRCTLFDKPKKFCQRCSEFHDDADWLETCERYIGAAAIRQCRTCGGWHALDRYPGNCMPEPNWNRSDHPSPMIISDNLAGGVNGTQSMGDGRFYDSKSALRKHYKERDLVEVGNEFVGMAPEEREARPSQADKDWERDVAMDLKKTISQLKDGTLTDGAMGNMLRPENAPVEGGFSVETPA